MNRLFAESYSSCGYFSDDKFSKKIRKAENQSTVRFFSQGTPKAITPSENGRLSVRDSLGQDEE